MKCERCLLDQPPQRHDCAEVMLKSTLVLTPLERAFVLNRYRDAMKRALEAEKTAARCTFVLETYRKEAQARAALVAKFLKMAIGKEFADEKVPVQTPQG